MLMEQKKARQITVENAKIAMRNFSGRPDKYSGKTDRTFLFICPDDMVDELKAAGWNVKQFKPREDQEQSDYYIPVTVSYKVREPNVMLVTRRKKVKLSEDTIDQLDWAEIDNIDLVITPYRWENLGKTGIKAYLKTMYVTVVEDAFADKYDFSDDEEECPFEV